MGDVKRAARAYCEDRGRTLAEIGRHKDDQRIEQLKHRILIWAIIGYLLYFYAIVKLCMTLLACPGEGYNLNGCAPIPWACQNRFLHPDTVMCIQCATGSLN